MILSDAHAAVSSCSSCISVLRPPRSYSMTTKNDVTSGHRERLRERFAKSPLRTLPDYEILEMLLFSVFKQCDTKSISKALLKKFGSLKAVITADPFELSTVDGIGERAVNQLKLLRDTFSRLMLPVHSDRVHILNDWLSVLHYCQFILGTQKNEHFHVLFLNKKNALITEEVFNSGTVDRVTIYPREVAKRALCHFASAVIIVHNHPSGDVTPSQEDIEITKKIQLALAAVNIVLHDHLITASDEHYSFKANNLI